MTLGVGDGRRERFGVVGVAGGVGRFLGRSGGVTGLETEIFVVVFVVDGGVGVWVEVVSLSSSLLKRGFIALTTSSFVWCCGGGEAGGFAILRALSSARFAVSRHANLSSYGGFGVEEGSALAIVREDTKVEKLMTGELKGVSEQERRGRVDLACKRVYFKICLLKTKGL